MAVKRKTAAVRRTVKTAAAATRRRRRSSPIKLKTKRRRRSGMAEGPMGKGLTPLLMQTAGGAAVGLLSRVPKPTFLATVSDTMFQAGIGIVGGFVTQKFMKQPALAAGMFGAAGFLLTQSIKTASEMAEEDYPLAEYEIVDEEDLQELEELEELEEDDEDDDMEEDDDEGIYRTPTGELVMMSDDGQNYFRVNDGSMYIPGSE
jgi:hypothetical protein